MPIGIDYLMALSVQNLHRWKGEGQDETWGEETSAPGWLVVVPRAFARHGTSQRWTTGSHRNPWWMMNQKPSIKFSRLSKWDKECTNVTRTRWWFRIFFIFTLKMGEDEPILTSIFFQRVWFNHQRENHIPFRLGEHLMSMVPGVDVDWWSSFAAVVVQWAIVGSECNGRGPGETGTEWRSEETSLPGANCSLAAEKWWWGVGWWMPASSRAPLGAIQEFWRCTVDSLDFTKQQVYTVYSKHMHRNITSISHRFR